MSWFDRTQLAKTIRALRNGSSNKSCDSQLVKTMKTLKNSRSEEEAKENKE